MQHCYLSYFPVCISPFVLSFLNWFVKQSMFQKFMKSQDESEAKVVLQIEVPKFDTTIESLLTVFKGFIVSRAAITSEQAFIEFRELEDISQIRHRFPEMIIPELGNAAIVQLGLQFIWEQDISPYHSEWMFPNPKNLLLVSHCSSSTVEQDVILHDLKQLLKLINLNFVRQPQSRIILEFDSQDDKQRFTREFENNKVPQFGANAIWERLRCIEATQGFSLSCFISNTQSAALIGSSEQNIFHKDIVPKMNRATSFQQQFLSKKEQAKQQKPTLIIDETQEQHHHSDHDMEDPMKETAVKESPLDQPEPEHKKSQSANTYYQVPVQ